MVQVLHGSARFIYTFLQPMTHQKSSPFSRARVALSVLTITTLAGYASFQPPDTTPAIGDITTSGGN